MVVYIKYICFLFSQIKLYTKQGSLKYQTDCAPINGYFMIPLYDKVCTLLPTQLESAFMYNNNNNLVNTSLLCGFQGDFVLKIEPPLGWSFGKNIHHGLFTL